MTQYLLAQHLDSSNYAGERVKQVQVFAIADDKLHIFMDSLKKDWEFFILPVENGTQHILRKSSVYSIKFLTPGEVDVLLDAQEKNVNVELQKQSEGATEVGGETATGSLSGSD